jgi:ABC-type uncharacterized transport system permease subunit
MTADVLLTFFAGILGGALRVGVPFLFVSLGECLTEKSGRINLGLEGVLVLSAMAALAARTSAARRGRACWPRCRRRALLATAARPAVLAAARERRGHRHRADAARRRAWRSTWASR